MATSLLFRRCEPLGYAALEVFEIAVHLLKRKSQRGKVFGRIAGQTAGKRAREITLFGAEREMSHWTSISRVQRSAIRRTPMTTLKNPQHEAFAQALARGICCCPGALFTLLYHLPLAFAAAGEGRLQVSLTARA